MITTNLLEPVLENLFHRRASLPLKFIILGANIAGLSCAYNLRQAGHEVMVLEPRVALEELPIAICMPPNMTRPLLQCGLGPQLYELARKCPGMSYSSGSTLEFIGEMFFHDEVMEELDADVLVMNHDDLVQMLYKLAVDSGVDIQFSQMIAEIDPSKPSVMYYDGTEVCGDVIVGVYGESSKVRPLLETESDEEEGCDEEYYANYMFSIETSKLGDDDFLLKLAKQPPEWRIFMGNFWNIHTLSKDDGKALSVSLYLNENLFSSDIAHTGHIDLKSIILEDINPKLRHLLDMSEDVILVRHVNRPHLEDWHDDDGHIVVIGEAAYILNPGSPHASALAIGDAAVLGTLFSHIHARDQIPRLLAAFQELRQDRCNNVGKWELGVLKNSSLPPGPARDLRDEEMRLALQEVEEGAETYLAREWEEYRGVFGYDAYEAADEWWVEWGVLPDRLDGSDDTIAHLCIEVCDELKLAETYDA